MRVADLPPVSSLAPSDPLLVDQPSGTHRASVSQLAAASGGTGDVFGPANNLDNYVPVWAGANSKTLGGGRAIGAASATDLVDRAAGDGRYRLQSTALAPSDVGLANVENKSSATIRGELTSTNVTSALTYTPTSVSGLTGVQTLTAFKAGLALAPSDVGLANVENKSSATIRGELTGGNVTAALTYTPTSVTGATGVQSPSALKLALSLIKGDVGLGNVDNTSDASKPVSTLQQAALDTKLSLTGGTLAGKVILVTPGTSTASLNFPPGSAPSSPVDGDVWATSSGLFARIGGATSNLLASKLVMPTQTKTASFGLANSDTGTLVEINGSGYTISGSFVTTDGFVVGLRHTGTGKHTFAPTPLNGNAWLYPGETVLLRRDSSGNWLYLSRATSVFLGSATAASGAASLISPTFAPEDFRAVEVAFTITPATSFLDLFFNNAGSPMAVPFATRRQTGSTLAGAAGTGGSGIHLANDTGGAACTGFVTYWPESGVARFTSNLRSAFAEGEAYFGTLGPTSLTFSPNGSGTLSGGTLTVRGLR